jgi:hypothetical protein
MRHAFPARGVARGIVIQPADGCSRALRRQFLAGEIAVKRALVFRQLGGHQVGQRRMRPAALGKREAPAQEQHAAAAAVHEIADQVLLRGVK